jgi:hypothetical protein
MSHHMRNCVDPPFIVYHARLGVYLKTIPQKMPSLMFQGTHHMVFSYNAPVKNAQVHCGGFDTAEVSKSEYESTKCARVLIL